MQDTVSGKQNKPASPAQSKPGVDMSNQKQTQQSYPSSQKRQWKAEPSSTENLHKQPSPAKVESKHEFTSKAETKYEPISTIAKQSDQEDKK